MNKNKKFFAYKNKLILTNGSSLNITSIKYIKNYPLNFKIFNEINKINPLKTHFNKNKSNFIKKIYT